MALDEKALAAWLGDSIMARRGVGRAAAGQTHHLTEEMQGTYLYTMGPYSDPVLTVKPGDTVVVETRDAFEGKLVSESDKPSEKLRLPFVNPQNGPIMIEGGSWDQIKGAMPKMYEGTLAQIPLGRMGAADEIGNAVTFLASPLSGFTTGVNLVIDGGFTKRVNF